MPYRNNEIRCNTLLVENIQSHDGTLNMSLTELKNLDSLTAALSATEWGYMDGVTAGTGLASKALVLDANGTVLLPAPLRYDANTGITAFATGGQASATALTGEFNNVTTCATDGDSVKLPSAVGGEAVTVKNSGATSLAVFPATGDSINAMAVNLSINIAPGGQLTFRAISATVWETSEVLVLPAPTTQKGEFIVKASDNDGDTVTTLTNAAMGQATVVSIPDPGAATANVLLTDAANDQAVVTATAAELNLNDQTAQTETIDSGVAASIVKRVTKIDNTVTGAGAITLAAPGADMLGVVKVIEMVVDGGDVTLSLANVTGGSAATTCTWANVNEALILVGGTNKWHVIAESGVVLT